MAEINKPIRALAVCAGRFLVTTGLNKVINPDDKTRPASFFEQDINCCVGDRNEWI